MVIHSWEDMGLSAYDRAGKEGMLDNLTKAFHEKEGYEILSEARDIDIAGYQARKMLMRITKDNTVRIEKFVGLIVDDGVLAYTFDHFEETAEEHSEVLYRSLNTLFRDSDGRFGDQLLEDLNNAANVTDKNEETVEETTPESEENPKVLATIDSIWPIDIEAVKMVRGEIDRDLLYIKVRRQYPMNGNVGIGVNYVVVNNDNEVVDDAGYATINGLEQGQAGWAQGNISRVKLSYEDLAYIKITGISYVKNGHGTDYPLPSPIKIYQKDIELKYY